ncbi:hypothetical protein PFMC_04224 [Plasmodium falciparum CAMP/Malaysia]|uniref:Uncharacterized protein n=1 Tax=Plasmodium falciparum (isolate Camp / Malaysia) TaxID=5835 RepID=A0A024X2J0_PLAFC|nr:hypothetical protein PFMC_04224 [Plasmodium falciparum CAMP/Malaysia]
MEKTQENRVVETGQSSTKDSHFFFGGLWVIGAVLLNSKTFKGKQRSNKIFIKNEHVLVLYISYDKE